MTLELPHGPRRNEVFELTIERLSPKGFGAVTLDALVGPQKMPKRYTFFVRKTIPGDVVRAAVEKSKRGEFTCRVDELVTPSRMRTEPRCAHFGLRHEAGRGCGGCTLQSLDDRHQLMVKERMIARLFRAQGLDTGVVLPAIGPDDPWYYRNKMEFSFGTTKDTGDQVNVGLHPTGFRYDVLPLTECFLQSESTSQVLHKITDWVNTHGLKSFRHKDGSGFLRTLTIREGKRTGDRLVALTTSTSDVAVMDGTEHPAEDVARAFMSAISSLFDELGSPITTSYWMQHHAQRGQPTRLIEHHLSGPPTFREILHLPGDQALEFEIHPTAFFQPNTLQAEVLYAKALEYTGLMDDGATTVLDLYCGTGTIGLCMAPYARKILGIELNASAVENARINAAHNDIEHAQFFVGDVGKVLESSEFRTAAQDVDVIVVDPPRSGLLPQAREQLRAIDVPRLVYVSCNPATLARDAAELCAHGYTLHDVQPVDMFPHTYHVENVARFTKG